MFGTMGNMHMSVQHEYAHLQALGVRVLAGAVGVGGLPGRPHPLVCRGVDPLTVYDQVVDPLDSRGRRHWYGSKLYYPHKV